MGFDSENTVLWRQNGRPYNRRFERFYLLNSASWSLTIDEVMHSADKIHDLNSSGAQLQIAGPRRYTLGSIIRLKLSLLDSEIIKCKAVVKWIHQKSDGSFNLGLEFIDPYSQIAKAWLERSIKLHVAKEKSSPSTELLMEVPIPIRPVETRRPKATLKSAALRTPPPSLWRSLKNKLFN